MWHYFPLIANYHCKGFRFYKIKVDLMQILNNSLDQGEGIYKLTQWIIEQKLNER